MKNWYQSDYQDAIKELNTDQIKGLTKEEAQKRLEENGPNSLMETKSDTALIIFLKQFKDLLVIILIIAAIISYASGSSESTIVILLVITLNAILGTVQTLKAEKSLESLKKLSVPKVRVMRSGFKSEISSTELVVGDIVMVEAGDVIVGDGRLFQAFTLQVNESSLTGEVESVNKNVIAISAESALGDQVNMVFSSGLVTNGRGMYVVTETGMNTQIGKIATLMNETKQRKTPLQRSLDEFSKKLSMIIIGICILVFFLNYFAGNSVIDAMMVAVALAVAAIPEALASIVTIVLSIGTSKMAKEGAIIKNVNSVESLGCVSIICSDKTGTLTQNKMTAQKVYVNGELREKMSLDVNNKMDRFLLLGCALCNDSTVNEEERIGDPTELALVDLVNQYDYDEITLRNKYQRIDELPFDSTRKLMSTLHMVDDKYHVFVKGASDELMRKCKSILTQDGVRPLKDSDIEEVAEYNKQFAQEGLRVLGFAYCEQNYDTLDAKDEDNLTFVGLVSLMDPPRVESAQAVADAKLAGIKAIMITGDHKITARSIAKSIGIFEGGNDECVDGRELEAMSDEELEARLSNICVYARVAPEHKIRIVQAWQKRGNIVAMTGDGVNDAPALKSADIGIAMGITGTEVSKDAASMILTDDNFATIVKAIVTGRNVYQNIKNSIKYLLSGNLSGILCVLLASIFVLKVPFLPVHLLFINLVTDSLPAIAIGMEKGRKDVLHDKPRNVKESILDKATVIQIAYEGVLIGIFTMIAYFIGLEVSYPVATTMAFSTLCLSRLFHGFSSRNARPLHKIGLFTNKFTVYAFIVGFALLNGILLIPALHGLFAVTTITTSQLLMIYGLAFLPTVGIQIIKTIIDRKNKD
ncbi:MAG: cation-translocating P-type ATPase [Erysipelotrichaceae bacterium]